MTRAKFGKLVEESCAVEQEMNHNLCVNVSL